MRPTRCSFYIREPVGDEWSYTRVSIANPEGSGYLLTTNPPVVGDLIYLRDQNSGQGGVFRVVERSWLYSSWGSADWPHTAPESLRGPMLDLIVDPAAGPFVNETAGSETREGN